jgi:hypothetical protein
MSGLNSIVAGQTPESTAPLLSVILSCARDPSGWRTSVHPLGSFARLRMTAVMFCSVLNVFWVGDAFRLARPAESVNR